MSLTVKEPIFISGPMTGFEDWNYPKFNDVASKLRAQNYRVVNPAENLGGDPSMDRPWYLLHDLKQLFDCESVLLLGRWWESEGSQMEAHVAWQLEKDFFYWKKETLYPVRVKFWEHNPSMIYDEVRGGDK